MLTAASDPSTSTLAVLVPVIAAILTLIGVLAALWQKWAADRRELQERLEADRRDAWWQRTQWALDRVLNAGTDGTSRAIAIKVIQNLTHSQLASSEEREMLYGVAVEILKRADAALAGPAASDRWEAEVTIRPTADAVAAAQLIVDADRENGVDPDLEMVKLARGEAGSPDLNVAGQPVEQRKAARLAGR